MSPWLRLAVYAAAIFASSLLGTWADRALSLTHRRKQVAVSFVAGLMLGVALFHLLPHAVWTVPESDGLETAVRWMMAGLVFTVLLQRVFQFHGHGPGPDSHGPSAGDAHGGMRRGPFKGLGVAVGIGVHSLTEGAALGASARQVSADFESVGLFLAILLHKPLDALGILGSMRAAGIPRRVARSANLCVALACPLAACVTFLGVGLLGSMEADLTGRALALAAGALLCVALSDLLPEIQFHKHDRTLLTACFLLGIAVAYGLHFLEAVPGRGSPPA